MPLEQLADPTDTTYIPRPEWYFLFLFQTLKLFDGPLEVVGSVVLPALAVLALILVPFIDRGQMVKVTRRTVADRVRGTGGDRMGRADGGRGGDHAAPAERCADRLLGAHRLDAAFARGNGRASAYFRQENCVSLPRGRARQSRKIGPDLTATSIHKDAAWMIQHFKRPSAMRAGQLPCRRSSSSDAQLNSLAAFLLKLNPQQRQRPWRTRPISRRRAPWCIRRITAGRATW